MEELASGSATKARIIVNGAAVPENYFDACLRAVADLSLRQGNSVLRKEERAALTALRDGGIDAYKKMEASSGQNWSDPAAYAKNTMNVYVGDAVNLALSRAIVAQQAPDALLLGFDNMPRYGPENDSVREIIRQYNTARQQAAEISGLPKEQTFERAIIEGMRNRYQWDKQVALRYGPGLPEEDADCKIPGNTPLPEGGCAPPKSGKER